MPNTHPKVSIIVPVHNAGNRLKKCLQTLVEQTLRDIEIILVIDCPTDGSEVLCREFAAKDSRIVLVENKENLHIGLSRNTGLAAARGEYIGFSDHDDFRELNMYETLYNQAIITNSDIVFSPSKHVNYKNGQVFIENQFDFLEQQNIQISCLEDLIGNGNNNRQESLFINILGCIYRRVFLEKHRLKFVDTKTITPEDIIFQIETFSKTENICILPTFFYSHISHRNNEGSKKSYKEVRKRCLGLDYVYKNLPKERYVENFYCYVQKQFLGFLAQTIIPFPNPYSFIKTKEYLKSFIFCQPAFKRNRLIYNKKGIKLIIRLFLLKVLQ